MRAVQAASVLLSVLVLVGGAAEKRCEPLNDETSAVRCVVENLDAGILEVENSASVNRIEIECQNVSHISENFSTTLSAGFRNLRELSVHRCGLGHLKRGVFFQFPSLESLSLRTFNREWTSAELKLDSGTFAGLQYLEILDLSDNNLWSLGDDVFKSLPSLKLLNLTGNSFQALMELGRAGITPNLQVLDVSRNNLLELSPVGMEAFPHLRELRLRDNKMTVILDGALRDLKNLELLDVSDNSLVALPAMMLNESRKLRDLRVQSNNIRVLPPSLLADLPQLQSVNMSFNNLSSQWIRKDTFAGLLRLIVLDLSHNELDSLSMDVFHDLSSLQVLDLGYNLLQTLPGGVFKSLSNLHTLSLSGNLLARLEQRSLEGLHVLSRLRLDSNRLTRIDTHAFTNVSSIQELNLQDNHLLSVPKALSRLTFLSHLDLGENFIGAIKPESLKSLQQLTYLRLSVNQLNNITAGCFTSQTSLAVLDLSRNRIDNIESGSFDAARNLRVIRLDANRLNNINGLLAKLPQLLWLNASDNQIGFFDYALFPVGLRWLDLHSNQIKDIGNFYKMESKIQLETLDLSHNQVSHLSSASVPDSIKYFILASNQLSTVESGTFQAKQHIVRIDLSSNQLSELDLQAVTLSENTSLLAPRAELLLAGNPFFCDCHMDWLLSVVEMTPKHKYPKVLDVDRVMCRLHYSPNRPVSASSAQSSDFLCTYQRHCYTLCHCCNYVACDCEMKCPDGCTCYHDRTWNTNIVDCSRREQVAISRELPMDATAVFASGNNIRSLESHTFIGRKRIRYLYVNGSGVEEIQNRSLNGLVALQVLRLEDNLLPEIRAGDFDALVSLRELYLHNNRISKLNAGTFSKLHSLEVLTLHGNEIVTFPVWQLQSPYLVELTLAGNPWSCDCDFTGQLAAYLEDHRGKVDDVDSIQCVYTDVRPDCGGQVTTTAVQRRSDDTWLLLAVVLGAALVVAAVVAGLVVRFRSKLCGNSTPPAATKSTLVEAASVTTTTRDVDKLYDVFVTYSAQDTRFVNEVLAPRLEHATPAYRLCLLRRDAPSTGYLGDAVQHCVQTSRRTLVVLSRNFLDNEWCRFDFKQSHLDALRHTRGVVAVTYGPVERAGLEGDLRTMLKSGDLLRYGEPDFWRRLRLLLPTGRGLKALYGLEVANGSARAGRDAAALQTILTGNSPSPTCSTLVSEDMAAQHGRSDSSHALVYSAQAPHNNSYSSIHPSEHTYMTIEQYQTAAEAAGVRIRPPEAQVDFCSRRGAAEVGGRGHQSAMGSDLREGEEDGDIYSTLEPEVSPQMPSDPSHPGNHHHPQLQQRSLSHSLWV